MPKLKLKADDALSGPKRGPSTLKKLGGSVVATIPPHLLRELDLSAGTVVSVERSGDQLVIRRAAPKKSARRIGLAARLARCDFSQPLSPEQQREDEAWDRMPPVGREEI